VTTRREAACQAWAVGPPHLHFFLEEHTTRKQKKNQERKKKKRAVMNVYFNSRIWSSSCLLSFVCMRLNRLPKIIGLFCKRAL